MSVAVGPDRRVALFSRRNAARLGVVAGFVVVWYLLTLAVGAGVLPGPGRTLWVATDGLFWEG